MKTAFFLLATCLYFAAGIAQTVHSVPAYSKGNHLTLTLANESPTVDAQNVTVKVDKGPETIKFAQQAWTLKLVPHAKESDAVFTFDVDRDAKINKKDTVQFSITDKSGSRWTKSVIVSYSGPQVYKLEQNFPNPFNPTTMIWYQLPLDSRVKIMVYDILGREVRTLVDEAKTAGYYNVQFDARGMASGTYFCRLVAEQITGKGSYASVKKMMVLK